LNHFSITTVTSSNGNNKEHTAIKGSRKHSTDDNKVNENEYKDEDRIQVDNDNENEDDMVDGDANEKELFDVYAGMAEYVSAEEKQMQKKIMKAAADADVDMDAKIQNDNASNLAKESKDEDDDIDDVRLAVLSSSPPSGHHVDAPIDAYLDRGIIGNTRNR
jgi:hypothetical protein